MKALQIASNKRKKKWGMWYYCIHLGYKEYNRSQCRSVTHSKVTWTRSSFLGEGGRNMWARYFGVKAKTPPPPHYIYTYSDQVKSRPIFLSKSVKTYPGHHFVYKNNIPTQNRKHYFIHFILILASARGPLPPTPPIYTHTETLFSTFIPPPPTEHHS